MYVYDTLQCALAEGVLTVTINNPPCNVMTVALYRDLVNFTKDVADDNEVRVIVLESADPDFFIAHFDIELLLQTDINVPAVKRTELNGFHAMCHRLATMPKVSIVKMAGRAGGGGNEFAACADMRFGLRNRTKVNQMEVALGILPGGSGTQMLPRLVGRGRAMEIVLGSDDIDAQTLCDWGYLNRVFDNQLALDTHVDQLARRIASFPPEAVALCKQSVNNAELELEAGLVEEAYLFQQTLRAPGAFRNMQRALALGAQTREGELRMGELCAELGQLTRELNDQQPK
ncbi:MAG: enoyl-CoA hydratase/isomerase family protein [Pseudomonadota bacterium]